MNVLSKLTFLCLSSLFLTACVVHVGPGSYKNPGSSTDSVFGDVRVNSGQTVGHVSSVNGSILLSHRVTAEKVSTVNGDIEVGDLNHVQELSTVNGDIIAGRSLMSNGKIETINGDIRLRKDSVIQGNVTSINGDIQIDSAHAHGDVETHTGNINITGSTKIDGDIRFKRDHNDRSHLFNTTPTLVIEQTASINGNIYLEREVELDIADPAITQKIVYLFTDK